MRPTQNTKGASSTTSETEIQGGRVRPELSTGHQAHWPHVPLRDKQARNPPSRSDLRPSPDKLSGRCERCAASRRAGEATREPCCPRAQAGTNHGKGLLCTWLGSSSLSLSAQGGTRRRHPPPEKHPGHLRAWARLLEKRALARPRHRCSQRALLHGHDRLRILPRSTARDKHLKSQGGTGGPRGRQAGFLGQQPRFPVTTATQPWQPCPPENRQRLETPQQRQVPRSLTRFLHAAEGRV